METHISAVFRGTDTVWKLKKAVRLGFLDFSAVPDRKRFLERELALNAPHAPGLYRDVVPVVCRGAGLALGGAGEVVDHVLRMAPVPEGNFLDAMAASGSLDAGMLAAVADTVAAMHEAQPRVGEADPVGRMREVALGNADAAMAAGLPGDHVSAWRAAMLAALERAAPLLAARGALVRRAHGDLHLGNMVLWEGRPVPFDALEFDEALATIDPGYDLAFLLMDLDRLASRAAANAVLNRYVARTLDAGLVGGLAPFLSLRAMIRAHVEAARGRDWAALACAALAYLGPARCAVLAVGGLMGTGKSTLARALAPGMGPAPGALVLRSDEVRKQIFGVRPEQRLPAEAYSAEAHGRTEDALVVALAAAVQGGHSAIVDATCLDAGFRARVADACGGVRFLGVWLEAPLAELERRVSGRSGDASDAGVGVLRAAWTAAMKAGAPAGWVRVDATDAGRARDQVQSLLAML